MKLRADQIEQSQVSNSEIVTESIEFENRDFTDAEIIDFVSAPAGKIIIPLAIGMIKNITTAYENSLAFNVGYSSGNSISGFVVEANTGYSASVKTPNFSNFPNPSNEIKIAKGGGAENAGIGKIKFTIAYYLIDTL